MNIKRKKFVYKNTHKIACKSYPRKRQSQNNRVLEHIVYREEFGHGRGRSTKELKKIS
jgi:hypothetical protein